MKDYLIEFMKSTGDLTVEVIILRLFAATVLAGFIFLSYRISHMGAVYSKKFNISLLPLTIVTATVMIVIGNNLALSLGMVGALSIVRFRTAVKDSRDTIYIFWTIVVGICCGVGEYPVAAIGSAFIFLTLLVFGHISNDNRILLILRTVRENELNVEGLLFRRFGSKLLLRAKNTSQTHIEFIYEVSKRQMKKDAENTLSLTDEVYTLDHIEYFNVITQSDEIGS